MGFIDLLFGSKKKKSRSRQQKRRREDEWARKEREWKEKEKQWRLKEKRIKNLQKKIIETEKRRRNARAEIRELEVLVRNEKMAKEKQEWLEKLDRWREEEKNLERNAGRQRRTLALQAEAFRRSRHSDYEDGEIDDLEDDIENYTSAKEEALEWVDDEQDAKRSRVATRRQPKKVKERHPVRQSEAVPEPERRASPVTKPRGGEPEPEAIQDYDDFSDVDAFDDIDRDDDDHQPLSIGVLKELNFSNFVVGENNRFPFVAAQSVAKAPAKAYNPLFIWGDVGLGKTHLLHSIANYIVERDPNVRIVYVSSETFTNHLMEAVEKQSLPDFRKSYRDIDVLLIDDIQFIAGNEHTQEEFFHTFNELYNNRHQIVISSDRPPSEIQALEKRLRSRFEGGLITEVKPPSEDIRMAILREKIKAMDIYVPDDVVRLVARNIRSNVRELNGALNRLKAFSAMTGAAISLDTAEKALEGLIPSDAGVGPERTASVAMKEGMGSRSAPGGPSPAPDSDMDMILQLEKESGLGSGEIMDDFEVETKKMEEDLMAELRKQGIEFG